MSKLLSILIFAIGIMAFSGVNAENKGSPAGIENSISHEKFISIDDAGDFQGDDLAKIKAILPLELSILREPVQNPNEGLQAYAWDKDERNRIYHCRNNC